MTDISKHFTGETSQGTSSTEPNEFKQLIGAKAGLMVGIFFLTLISSYTPWILGKARIKHFITIISILTCAAAGVIIGGGFAHILPGAEGSFESYFASLDNPDEQAKNFPWASSIAIFVLFLLVALDKIIVEKGFSGEKGHNHMNLSEHSQNYHNHSELHSGEVQLSEVTPDGNEVTPGGDNDDEDLEKQKPKSKHGHGHGHSDDKKQFKHHEDDGHSHHSHKQGNGKTHAANLSQAWVFLIALSIHSILDGLGLGAENNKSGFYGLLVAVLAHKLLDGFALGVPVYFAQFSFLKASIGLVFCAAMTPLGIGIGMAISSSFNSSSSDLAQAIILSVTCGSFFYISLIELLPSGLCTPGWLKLKLLVAFLGWAIMTVIALWV